MEKSIKKELESGTYAKKQLFAGCNILRWSHQARFVKGSQLIKRYQPNSLLDYGCGDGTFLVFAKDNVKNCSGMEIDTNHLKNLKERFKDSSFKFFHIDDDIAEKKEMVTCFEVLEHCTDENIDKIIHRLSTIVAQDGRVVISVPKETGLTMVGKQLVRRILALRKFGTYEYSEWYKPVEFFKMLFATENTQIHRHFYEVEFANQKYLTCGHKGFNWKSLRPKISKYLEIEKVEFTPFILPFGLLSSQVWFICKPKKL